MNKYKAPGYDPGFVQHVGVYPSEVLRDYPSLEQLIVIGNNDNMLKEIIVKIANKKNRNKYLDAGKIGQWLEGTPIELDNGTQLYANAEHLDEDIYPDLPKLAGLWKGYTPISVAW